MNGLSLKNTEKQYLCIKITRIVLKITIVLLKKRTYLYQVSR